MKINKEEFNLLFQSSSSTASSEVLREAERAAATGASSGVYHEQEALQILRRACPTLWGKMDPAQLTKRELRQRMLELLRWLASKNSLTLLPNASLAYHCDGAKVDGRVYAILQGVQCVSLELCFSLDVHSLLKLRAAQEQGNIAVLLWAGKRMSKKELLEKICLALKCKQVPWLNVILLTAQSPTGTSHSLS